MKRNEAKDGVQAMGEPVSYQDAEACVDQVIKRVGKNIVLGLPLGLGKPLRFVNALYARAQCDPTIKLHIVTALSLLAPAGSSSLERRFLGPFIERLYGDIPELAYARDAQANRLPDNVTVAEFFFQAGNLKNNTDQQRHYICTNYTHALRDLMAQGINVIGQLVSPDERDETVSLSCNPDLTLDLLPQLREQPYATACVAETNRHLPYLGNDAAVARTDFDLLLESPGTDYPLFSAPQTPISSEDHLIGFYASTLLKDAGTLQIGIGSLGAALVHSTLLRQRDNARWQALYKDLQVAQRFPVAEQWGDTQSFSQGLYGCSEMMVDGFIYLMEGDVLKRRVFADADFQEAINRGEIDPESSDHPDAAKGVVMHGGFYLGPRRFYDKLRELPAAERARINMTSVNYINDLYDHRFGNQRLKVAQRQHARFINSAMLCTIDGAVVSDGLEDGRVISGVGGQYNFVAMAHELSEARSVITLRSTREAGGKTLSNILFSYGHCTIPRHLRDIVVTEYGIADLRGRSDEEVCLALIAIADARFQSELLAQAKDAGKVAADVEIPALWRDNTPEQLAQQFERMGGEQVFPRFPFGTDFTDEELTLGKALKQLKARTATRSGKLKALLGALGAGQTSDAEQSLLARLELDRPSGWNEHLERRLVLQALRSG
ncbi:acetyl-CoA hydrolase/transferase C-terminal domain-containing protein [Halomonas sp. DQ26W]|uniref:acetyl-CoA hydrolase/transferase C-terminal domain-containing protein n=1 Tax=Halomonas sp. DQ26W TaxID=2282311 RepID=UPI002161B0F3|nr:acetyl-CoA hydrolase/transferase C-terminal domain-containing protein [Halomonas sp. DQ26W]